MILSAFHGDSDSRKLAQDRLAGHMEQKSRLPGLFQWDGAKGTMAACLIDSGDPDEWEKRLGLSPWLAYAIDAITGSLDTPRATRIVDRLLDAIAPGIDTAPLAHVLVIAMLDEIGASEALEPALADASSAIRETHEKVMAGSDLPPSEWRRLRRMAVAGSDAVPSQEAAGAVIEAAAWNPRYSPTIGGEILRHWIHYETVRARRDYDWTPADDSHIRALLEKMHGTYIAPNPEEKRDVFQLLEVYYPGEATRLRAYIAHGNDSITASSERGCQIVQRVLEANVPENPA